MTRWYHLLLFSLFLAQPAAAATPLTVDVVIYTKKGEVPLKLEVAATPKAREIGLMKRERIGAADGMLFLFPEAGRHGFWMKETHMPLDIIFVTPKQRISEVAAEMEPYSLKPHIPRHKILTVIELDGGRAARESIGEGDNVRYALPASVMVH